MIRIFLVDDHPMVREGLNSILSSEPDFLIVGEAEKAEEALREAAFRQPDVAIVDVRLAGGASGIDLCSNLLKRHPGLRVLILTSFSDEGTMLASFEAGARGFMVKDSPPATLRLAVRSIVDSGTFIDPKVAGKLVAAYRRSHEPKGAFGLSTQERRVLRFLPRGYTNREIARELGISEHTVKTHLRNTMRKLGVSDRAKAAAVARREGLV